MNAAWHRIVNLLKTWWDFLLWLCRTMYLVCGPRQLFFFQCGLEMSKGWTPVITAFSRPDVLGTSQVPGSLFTLCSLRVVCPNLHSWVTLPVLPEHWFYSSQNYAMTLHAMLMELTGTEQQTFRQRKNKRWGGRICCSRIGSCFSWCFSRYWSLWSFYSLTLLSVHVPCWL